MCIHAKSLQSCLTFCNPMDCSLPGSSIHGILQARILGCFAMPSSRGSSQPRDWTRISYASCFVGGFFTTEPLGKSSPWPWWGLIQIIHTKPLNNRRHGLTVSLWVLKVVCCCKTCASGGPWAFVNFPQQSTLLAQSAYLDFCCSFAVWHSSFPWDWGPDLTPGSFGWGPDCFCSQNQVELIIRCSQLLCFMTCYTLLSLVDLSLHVLGQVYVIPGITM